MRCATISLVLATVILNANVFSVKGGAKTCGGPSDEMACENAYCVGDATARCEAGGEAGGGECFTSLVAFLKGQSEKAASTFKYGKYCGKFNRCSMYEPTQESCTCYDRPAPCDSIDAACMVHDRCYDGEDITCDDRTECDIKFISALNTVLVAALQGDIEPTGLCDDEFYTANLGSLIGSSETITGIDIVMHESILVAAPYCCGSIKSGCTGTGGSGEPGECDGATNICGIFERALGC